MAHSGQVRENNTGYTKQTQIKKAIKKVAKREITQVTGTRV